MLTESEFAKKIKAKYPEYSKVPDAILVQKIIEKHPEYKDQVQSSFIGKAIKATENISPEVTSAGAGLAQASQDLNNAPSFGEKFTDNLKAMPGVVKDKVVDAGKTVLQVAEDYSTSPLNPGYLIAHPVDSAKQIIDIGKEAYGASKGGVDIGVEGVNQTVDAWKNPDLTTGEKITETAEGGTKLIGGALQTVFGGPMRVAEEVPGVKPTLNAVSERVDALSSFGSEALGYGLPDKEKASIKEGLNNLFALMTVKYGPEVTAKAQAKFGEFMEPVLKNIKDLDPTSPLAQMVDKANGVKGSITSKFGQEGVVKSNLAGLSQVEGKLKPVADFISDAKAKGFDVKEIVSKTDLLKDAVDADGVIRTKQDGGAVSQVKSAMEPADGVVLKALEAEGKTIPLEEVGAYLKNVVNENKGLYGKTLTAAEANVAAEVEGLARYADAAGNIPLSSLQNLKIARARTVDYSNPESALVSKDIIRGAKELIEQKTKSIDVGAINKELQKLYTVQEFLELLDMKRVQGARLGKYFAQTVGTIVGSAGGPLVAIMGGELAKLIYGKSMQGTFKGSTGGELKLSDQMKGAIDQSSKNVGNLNTSQSATNMNVKTPITETLPPSSGKSSFNTAGTAKSATSPKPKSVVELGESKTMNPLIEEAKKYKNAEEFRAMTFNKALKLLRGVEQDSIVTVPTKSVKIIWKDDYINAKETAKSSYDPNTAPPVELIYDLKTGKYKLDDGHNRFVAAERNNQPIKGEITKIDGNMNELDAMFEKETGVSLTDIWNKANGK